MDLTARGRNPEVGITAHDATISFRVLASGATVEDAERAMAPTLATSRERFGSLILGEGTADLPEAVFAELQRTGSTLSTAESCTGGLIAHKLTAIAGVSPHYPGGVTWSAGYANEAKSVLLGLDPALIREYGAVSEQVAAAMAVGVRNRLYADIGLSVTGVAGPSGGTAIKPVGHRLSRSGDGSRRVDPSPRHRTGTTSARDPKSCDQARAQLGSFGTELRRTRRTVNMASFGRKRVVRDADSPREFVRSTGPGRSMGRAVGLVRSRPSVGRQRINDYLSDVAPVRVGVSPPPTGRTTVTVLAGFWAARCWKSTSTKRPGFRSSTRK